MTQRMKWRSLKRDEDGLGGFFTTAELSKGFNLRIEFTVNEDDPTDNDVSVGIAAYRGKFNGDYHYRKQGSSLGPGGSEAFIAARDAILAAEIEAVERYPKRRLRMIVDGASDRLARIYEWGLSQHGYEKVLAPAWTIQTRVMAKSLTRTPKSAKL